MHVGSHAPNHSSLHLLMLPIFLLDENFTQPSYLGITEIILFNAIKLHPCGKGCHRLYVIIITMEQRNKSSPTRIDSKRAIFFLQVKISGYMVLVLKLPLRHSLYALLGSSVCCITAASNRGTIITCMCAVPMIVEQSF